MDKQHCRSIVFAGMSAPMALLARGNVSHDEIEADLKSNLETVEHDLRPMVERGSVFSAAFRLQLAWLRGGIPIAFGGQPRDVDYYAVIREIEHIDGIRKETSTRRESPFRGILTGFWHKHFFDANALATNMRLEVERNFERLFHEKFVPRLEAMTGKPWIGSELDEKAIGLLVHTVGLDGLDLRRGALSRGVESRLTGEWIVYAKEDRRHTYLTLAYHGEIENELKSLAARLWIIGDELPLVRDRLKRNGVHCDLANSSHP